MKNKHYALKITGILILIFIIQLFFKNFTELFVLNRALVLIRPWTLITSIFLHGSLAHLMLNGFALALFGSILENIIGSKRFLVLFFIGGIFANIPSIIFYNSSLGASGAIFGVLGCLTILRPKMIVWLNFMPVPMWLAAIIWALQDVLGVFIPDNIANLAHLGGLFFGLIYGFYIRPRGNKKGLNEDFKLNEEAIKEWENTWPKG